MVELMLVFFVLVGMGYLARVRGWLSVDAAKPLEWLVVEVTVPALIVLSFVRTPVKQEHLNLVVLGVVTVLVATLVYLVLFRVLIRDRRTYGTAVPLAFFSNAGFMGLPIMLSLFGEEGVSLALPFQMFSHGPVWLFLIGGIIYSYFGQSKKKKNWGRIIGGVFLSPAVLAVFVGLGLYFVTQSEEIMSVAGVGVEFLMKILELAANANTFLVMFLVGVMLNPKRFSAKLLWPVMVVVFANLFLTPLITFGVGGWFVLEPMSLSVAVLESAMPMAVLALVLVREYKLNVELAEAVLFVSTLLSLVTLPLVKYLVF